jgi:hypothetical protein
MKKLDSAVSTISAIHSRPAIRCREVPLRISSMMPPISAAGTTVAT